MAIFKRASSQALVLAGALLAGCAMEGTEGVFTTGSLNQASAKTDPVCVTLAARIEALRKDGIPDKIEKAAAKRYRLTKSDLRKADQLNKVNADFRARCSTIPAATTAAAPADDAKGSAKKVAKAAPKASSPKAGAKTGTQTGTAAKAH